MDNQIIHRFFAAYEKRFNKMLLGHDDVAGTVSAFADYVVSANPAGVYGGKNDRTFERQIIKGNAYYKTTGAKQMQIRSLDINWLDQFHSMAKVSWSARYLTKEGTETAIDFDVFYFLQVNNNRPKIFAYITGDEQKALRDKGIG